MDLSLITARIADQVAALSTGSRVAGAAELQAALVNPDQLIKPCAFVIWANDVPIDQSPVPGQEARFREDFVVVVAVDNSVDGRGEDGVATVETLGIALNTALVGWAPSSGHLPVYYAGSTHVEMSPSRLLHSFSYSTVKPGGSIFTYNVTFRSALIPGATIADVYTLYSGKVDDVIGADTRLDSDYLIEREAIPESETRYQLRFAPAGVDDRSDSNAAVTELAVALSVHHHLAPDDVERAYTEGTMVTALETLLPPSYWRDDMTLIREVLEAPTLGLGADLARE